MYLASHSTTQPTTFVRYAIYYSKFYWSYNHSLNLLWQQ